MLSSSRRACSASSTVVLPVFTTCFGPRTACAGLVATIWPVTSQSNSMRMAARCCLTDGFSKPLASFRYRRRRATARCRRAGRSGVLAPGEEPARMPGNRPCGCSCCGSSRRRIPGNGAPRGRRRRRSIAGTTIEAATAAEILGDFGGRRRRSAGGSGSGFDLFHGISVT